MPETRTDIFGANEPRPDAASFTEARSDSLQAGNADVSINSLSSVIADLANTNSLTITGITANQGDLLVFFLRGYFETTTATYVTGTSGSFTPTFATGTRSGTANAQETEIWWYAVPAGGLSNASVTFTYGQVAACKVAWYANLANADLVSPIGAVAARFALGTDQTIATSNIQEAGSMLFLIGGAHADLLNANVVVDANSTKLGHLSEEGGDWVTHWWQRRTNVTQSGEVGSPLTIGATLSTSTFTAVSAVEIRKAA